MVGRASQTGDTMYYRVVAIEGRARVLARIMAGRASRDSTGRAVFAEPAQLVLDGPTGTSLIIAVSRGGTIVRIQADHCLPASEALRVDTLNFDLLPNAEFVSGESGPVRTFAFVAQAANGFNIGTVESRWLESWHCAKEGDCRRTARTEVAFPIVSAFPCGVHVCTIVRTRRDSLAIVTN